MEAESVAARLREQGKSVGTASVYRALSLLADLGLLHKTALPDSPTRFELVLPGGEHHHHIVCENCGRTEPFSDPDLERAVTSISDRVEFEIASHDITLYGTCAGCRAA